MPRGVGRLLKGTVYMGLFAPAVFGAQWLVNTYWPNASSFMVSGAVFALTKLVGDGLQLVFYPRDDVFGGDLIYDLVVFSGIGLVAGVAIELAVKVVGGPVAPAIPAIGGYLVFGFATRSG